MSELKEIQRQLEDLQSQVAFQEDTIEQLNQVITKQDAIIRKMEERFVMLGEKLQDMESQLPNKPFNPADELPPHY